MFVFSYSYGHRKTREMKGKLGRARTNACHASLYVQCHSVSYTLYPFVRQAKRIVHRLHNLNVANCLWGKNNWLVFCVCKMEISWAMAFWTFPIMNTCSYDYCVYIFLTEHCDYGLCDCSWLYKTDGIDTNHVILWKDYQSSRSTILL